MKLWFVALTAVVVSSRSSAEAQCLCGEELNSTGSCVLIAGLNQSFSRACDLANDRFCDTSQVNAVCECGCYWTGANCDVRENVEVAFQVVAILVPLLVILAGIAYIYRLDKKTEGQIWDRPQLDCVDSPFERIGPKAVLAYRFVMAGVAWGILLDQNVGTEGRQFRAFTIWNWVLLTIYFTIGLGLSLRHAYTPVTANRLTYLERFFWIIMVVETVSVVLVMIVFWAVLFPTVPADFQPFLTSYTSIFQHALNVPIMYGDFFLSGLPIEWNFYVYVLLWAALYALFHSCMLVDGYLRDEGFECPVYFFLDINSFLLVPWQLGLLLAYALFHFIGVKLSQFKLSLQPEDTKGGQFTSAHFI